MSAPSRLAPGRILSHFRPVAPIRQGGMGAVRKDEMTRTRHEAATSPAAAALLERLRTHRTLSQLPREELEWLVAHGTLEHYTAGQLVGQKGDRVPGMYIILGGRLSNFTDQGGTWRKVIDWREGDVTGYLPYSRMEKARGRTVADEAVEALVVPRDEAAALPVACPHLTRVLVHAMLDRTREFKSSDLQMEKLASLGKLAAGIAHELNNPASAARRSAQLLTDALAEADEASQALGSAQLSAPERAALDRVRAVCLTTPATGAPSLLEQADREAEIADWLADHGADEAFAADLAEADVRIETLAELSGAVDGTKLRVALRWVAAACLVRGLARHIEEASSRVHELVSAVKGFTYMDHAAAPEAVNVRKGLTDTLAVLAAKARGKRVALQLDAAADLPAVNGFGGELNQVWAILIDNAIDAVAEGGRVSVAASHHDQSVFVRVVDDGPGIAPEIKSRIFDPFFTTKPMGTGTGLGLDIAQRLVARHEGLIAVASEPGKTEFCVTLPVGGREVG
jgi:signal transduction histidine kinase